MANIIIAAGLNFSLIGGICGYNASVPPSGCSNSGNITVTRSERWGDFIAVLKCGGVIGQVESDKGEFYGCPNTGQITVTSVPDCIKEGKKEWLCIGGIAGYGTIAKISDCYNAGTVSVQGAYEASETLCNHVSGIAGSFKGCTEVEKCFNSGNVTFTASGISEDVNAKILMYTFVTELLNARRVNAVTVTDCFTSGNYDACQMWVTDASQAVKIAGTFYGNKLESGEPAYILHGDEVSRSNIWGQKLGTDAHPVFSRDVVHKHSNSYVNCDIDETKPYTECGIIDMPTLSIYVPTNNENTDYNEVFVSNVAHFQWLREFMDTLTTPIHINLLNDITLNTGTITA